jgi:hypothetical protein
MGGVGVEGVGVDGLEVCTRIDLVWCERYVEPGEEVVESLSGNESVVEPGSEFAGNALDLNAAGNALGFAGNGLRLGALGANGEPQGSEAVSGTGSNPKIIIGDKSRNSEFGFR